MNFKQIFHTMGNSGDLLSADLVPFAFGQSVFNRIPQVQAVHATTHLTTRRMNGVGETKTNKPQTTEIAIT